LLRHQGVQPRVCGLAVESLSKNNGAMVVRCLVVALLVGGATSAAADDYPVVDATIPVFGTEASARNVDDFPIVQDRIAEPWEPVKRLSGPRCGCDGIAVPDGW
jgi:hypothetical protein